MSAGRDVSEFRVAPIGILRTPFAEPGDAPIQGAFVPDSEATLEVFEEYAEGLHDIDGFSHLIVLYLLDRSHTVELQPVPFLDDSPHGVFATRNPRRPNHVALGVVRLLGRDGPLLRVGGVDALDGSPVIDVKPYVARFDSVPDATEGWYAGRQNRPKPSGRE